MLRIQKFQSCERVDRVYSHLSTHIQMCQAWVNWQKLDSKAISPFPTYSIARPTLHTRRIPDEPFHNFRASRSGDRQILFSSGTSCDGFWSSKIGKKFVWYSLKISDLTTYLLNKSCNIQSYRTNFLLSSAPVVTELFIVYISFNTRKYQQKELDKKYFSFFYSMKWMHFLNKIINFLDSQASL